MRRAAILLVFCFAALVPARAQFFDDKYANHWMTYYYVDKDVGHVGAFVHWLAGFDFAKNPNVSPPVTGFLIGVFTDNPSLVRGWVTDVAPNAEAKAAIERALWMSGHADLIADVFHDSPDYVARQAPSLMTLSLETPGMWDVMWSAFFATGNTAYPARLIDLLDDSVTFTGDPKVDAVYHQTVAWSVTSNMSQHELISAHGPRRSPTAHGIGATEAEGDARQSRSRTRRYGRLQRRFLRACWRWSVRI